MVRRLKAAPGIFISVISASGASRIQDRPADVTLSFESGTKATGALACLNKLGERIAGYDWVCIPDDDLRADLLTSTLLRHRQGYRLDLAQPALGDGSYVSHDIRYDAPT